MAGVKFRTYRVGSVFGVTFGWGRGREPAGSERRAGREEAAPGLAREGWEEPGADYALLRWIVSCGGDFCRRLASPP